MTTARDSPLITRLRNGKWNRSGAVPGGNSLSTTPVAAISAASVHVHADRCGRLPTRAPRSCSPCAARRGGRRVHAARQPAHDSDAARSDICPSCSATWSAAAEALREPMIATAGRRKNVQITPIPQHRRDVRIASSGEGNRGWFHGRTRMPAAGAKPRVFAEIAKLSGLFRRSGSTCEALGEARPVKDLR